MIILYCLLILLLFLLLFIIRFVRSAVPTKVEKLESGKLRVTFQQDGVEGVVRPTPNRPPRALQCCAALLTTRVCAVCVRACA